MSSTATRGAVLVAVAALLGFLVLRGAADNTQVPVTATTSIFEPTATVVFDTVEPEVVPVTTPTVVVDVTTARDNNQVSVLVVNGTDVSGQAGRLSSSLRNQGFIAREPRNGTAQATSVIYYRPTFQAEAAVVRNILSTPNTPIAPMPLPDPFLGDGVDLAEVDVLILIGADDLSTS